MRDAIGVIGPAAVGYLLGSIPTADLVSRRRRVDLRQIGDRNPGYWNARTSIGTAAARPVLIGDVAKGAAAAGVGWLVAGPGQWWPAVVGGGAAMVGHAWPVFAGFRGGRAVASFTGVALVISPLTTAVALGAGLVAGGLVTGTASRSLARGVRVGVAAYPLAQLAIDGPVRTAATGALMSFIGLRFLTARRTAPANAAPG